MDGSEGISRLDQGLEVNNSQNSRSYLIKLVNVGRPEHKVHNVAVEWMSTAKDLIYVLGSIALDDI